MNAQIQRSRLKINGAVMLIFTSHAWGNRKKADIKKIETSAEKSFLSLSKRLIESEKYKEVTNFQNSIRIWIDTNAVPSFFLRGAYLFNIKMVEEVEDYLRKQEEALKSKLDPLIEEYQQKINEASVSLSDQWNPADYPSPEELRKMFYFEWKWTIFDIPEGLPSKVFEAEKMKAENMWRESAEQISLCLRESFIKLIQHANSMLIPGEDGKNRKFKNSSFDNIEEFIATFKNRNIVNDKDLEELVEKAQKILIGVDDPQVLKTDMKLKKVVETNFKEIEMKLAEMIETKPNRKFDLE